MSTQIETLVGKFEGGKSEISMTRFWGGKDNGSMLQLTVWNEEECSYVQLTQKQIKELSVILNNSFNYEKYPSE
jgi:hypothetical protein